MEVEKIIWNDRTMEVVKGERMLDIDYEYQGCLVVFHCPVCGSLLVAHGDDGEKSCPSPCGLRYSLDYELNIIMPPEKEPRL